MTFSSLEYLVFLPIVFILYWTLCKRSKALQNYLLVAANCVFYAWWDWRFLGLLLLTDASVFAAGKLMQRYDDDDRKRKRISAVAIVFNLAILFYFKYFDFFIHSFASAFGITLTDTSTLHILMPVGISFYTFTAISYCVDVYRRKVAATDDFAAFFAFLTFFPAILSGPISRGEKQLPQYLVKRVFDYDKCVAAVKMILIGALMKFCLADRLGIYVDAVYSNYEFHNGSTLLLATILYTIQVYGDFAGYSLMAIGSGKLLGIDLPVNFIRPYFSQTIGEFWRRWHVSLSTWFRDYLYFPLGGSRVSRARWAFNIMVVFVVSGLWHGAAFGYIVWGAIHGISIVVEKYVYGDKLKKMGNRPSVPYFFHILVTLIIVAASRVFFITPTIGDALSIFGKIFTEPGALFTDSNTFILAGISFVIVAIYDCVEEYNLKLRLLSSSNVVVRYATAVALIWFVLACGVLNNSSFIYFKF